MSVLQDICARKAEHVERNKRNTSLEELREKIKHVPPPLGFEKALKNHGGTAIIAEIKKASPSKGLIRPDFDAVEIAKAYERAGAACLSCLTDEPYFQGKDRYLQAVKLNVSLPVLRKDFMIDPYQIYESRALGADCILLIMAALEDALARELYELSRTLGMDVLVEVHNREELERALLLNPGMIGVNNRNLKTLAVNIQTSHDLVSSIPDSVLKIAESGIDSRETIKRLKKSGYSAFLIGESLTRQPNIENALRTLL